MFDNNELYRQDLYLDPKHDGRHRLEGELGRESIPYMINLPEHGVALFVYTWVDVNGFAGAATSIYGPAVGAEPLQMRIPDRKIPDDMDFDNWQLDGLTMKQDLAFDKATVHWKTEEAEVYIDFEAFHPPYAYGSHKEGCPNFVAHDRIEQSATARGYIVLGDKRIDFNSTSHRDHSWGTRDWLAFQHYHWFQCQVGDDISINFWRLLALGKTFLRGYVYKDNLLAELTDIELETDYDDNFYQSSMQALLKDEAGRETTISGDFFGVAPLVPHPDLILNEGAAAIKVDGKRGAGWLEVAWPKAYLDHIRAVGKNYK